MSVVVTGAAGFIGRELTRRLAGAGHRVVAVDRTWRPAQPEPPVRPERSERPEQAGVTVLSADLLDGDPLVEVALREAEAVVHLAARSGVRDATPGVDRARRRDNVDATRVVAALVPPQVPLLVASSSSVYGGARFGRASREDDPLRPRGGYARSKVGTERACARRRADGGHVLVVRPFTVVGEGQRADMALSRWAADARAGRPLRVFGSLQRTRDFTCVREVARGLLALLDSGADGVVNLGTGAPQTLGALVQALAAALAADIDVRTEPAAGHEVPATWADVARLQALTGVRPHTDLHDVARRFVAAASPAAAPSVPSAPSAPSAPETLVGAG